MRNLNAIANDCITELKDIGIEPPRITFEVNSRAATRWGQCKKTNGRYSISIASVLMDEKAPLNGLKSTIMHEVLHTMPNCFDHGTTWQRYADKVNKAYGYKVTRTDSYKDKGFTSNPFTQAHPYKYTITCNCCGREWNYRRASDTVECCKHNNATCPCGAKDFTVTTNY